MNEFRFREVVKKEKKKNKQKAKQKTKKKKKEKKITLSKTHVFPNFTHMVV